MRGLGHPLLSACRVPGAGCVLGGQAPPPRPRSPGGPHSARGEGANKHKQAQSRGSGEQRGGHSSRHRICPTGIRPRPSRRGRPALKRLAGQGVEEQSPRSREFTRASPAPARPPPGRRKPTLPTDGCAHDPKHWRPQGRNGAAPGGASHPSCLGEPAAGRCQVSAGAHCGRRPPALLGCRDRKSVV